MSLMRRIVDALWSTKPLAEQRPFWPVLLVAGGEVLINGPSLALGRRDLASTYGGLATMVLGFFFSVCYCFRRARLGCARNSALTKAI